MSAAAVGVGLAVGAAAAWIEGRLRRPTPLESGFWSLARTVDGECHVRWGRGQTPVVRFSLPGGEARARAVRLRALPGAPRAGGAWVCEVRATFEAPWLGVVARLTWPPAPRWRFRTPGVAPRGTWSGAGLESTDAEAWAALLARAEVGEALAMLGRWVEGAGRGAGAEWVLAPGLVRARAWRAAPRQGAGAVMEGQGPVLAEALRALAQAVAEVGSSGVAAAQLGPPGGLAGASAGAAGVVAGERLVEAARRCALCQQLAGGDVVACRHCGAVQHRGCRVHSEGCVDRRCPGAVDAPPGWGESRGRA